MLVLVVLVVMLVMEWCFVVMCCLKVMADGERETVIFAVCVNVMP